MVSFDFVAAQSSPFEESSLLSESELFDEAAFALDSAKKAAALDIAMNGSMELKDTHANAQRLAAWLESDLAPSFASGSTTPFQTTPAWTDSTSPDTSTTVSPHDIYQNAAASVAWTTLTSPMFGSGSEMDASPLFTADDVHPAQWEPLFTPEEELAAAKPAPTSAPPRPVAPKSTPRLSPKREASEYGEEEDDDDEEEQRLPSGRVPKRQKSLGSSSSASPAPSSSRRVTKPLPPIVVDPSDTTAVKRARNTEAARKSRAKKMAQLEALEQRIRELEEERDFFKNKSERLETQLLQ